MTDNITLPRAVVEQVREALTCGDGESRHWCMHCDDHVPNSLGSLDILAALDAALAEPEHIHTCPPDCQKPLCVNRRREIAAAVEAEREACADYAAALAEAGWSAQSIADALRARGSK